MDRDRLEQDGAACRLMTSEGFHVEVAPTGEVVCASEPMRAVLAWVERIAPLKGSVLLTGETGTGKECVARAIHEASGRTGAFVAVNCSGLQEALLESELFGHRRGAFTAAAAADRPGLAEAAVGGTLFPRRTGRAAAAGTIAPVPG